MTLRPANIDLFTTQDCNLRCDYCYIPKQPQRMSQSTAQAAVDWLLRVCPRPQAKVFYFGGEPLLEFGLMQWVHEYGSATSRAQGKTFGGGVTTNGTVWTEEISRWIRDTKTGVNLSFDGLAESQDSQRHTKAGGPTHAKVVETLRDLLSFRPQQGVRMTYTADHVHLVGDNVNHVFELGCKSVFCAPSVQGDWTEERLRVLESQLLKLAKQIVSRGSNRYLRVGPLEKAVQKLTAAATKKPHSRRGKYQCGAGHSYLAVACDGSIWPCHRFVGLGAYRLGDVWGEVDAKNAQLWAEWDANAVLPGCYACPSRDICSGNCAAVNYAANGNIDIPSLTQCAITRIEARVGRWLMRHAPGDLLRRMVGKRRPTQQ